jgi:hypothetical protein
VQKAEFHYFGAPPSANDRGRKMEWDSGVPVGPMIDASAAPNS